tara:strand:- start:25592 stop:26518 length:927 start_codon:yes stop_codon:yes gene_type:complete
MNFNVTGQQRSPGLIQSILKGDTLVPGAQTSPIDISSNKVAQVEICIALKRYIDDFPDKDECVFKVAQAEIERNIRKVIEKLIPKIVDREKLIYKMQSSHDVYSVSTSSNNILPKMVTPQSGSTHTKPNQRTEVEREPLDSGVVVSSSDSPAPIDITDSDIKTCVELQKFIDGFNGSTETEKLDYSKSQARIKKDIREQEKKEKIEKEISKKVKKLILMIEKHHNLLKMKGSGSIENDEEELDIIEKNKKRLQKMSVSIENDEEELDTIEKHHNFLKMKGSGSIENDEEELDTSKDLAEHAIPKTLEL